MIIEYKIKDYLFIIKPLENGKCEYNIEFHDFGNLEGRFLTVSYQGLNYILSNPKEVIYFDEV